MDPIFIIGTERSGTNLLRVILNSHDNITVPHPPHIMKNMFPLEPLYFPLNKKKNIVQLIKDVVKTVELHPYPWEFKLNKRKILKGLKNNDLINIFFQVYDQYLEFSQKKRWCCKSTFMINHVSNILKYYPNAKFIYMVRDGRDVAVSARKSIFNHFNIFYIAQLWKKEQQIGMYWLNSLTDKNIFLVKYEDLISEPEHTVKNICSFLNEEYKDNMLFFFKTNEAQKASSISSDWKNTSSPILKNNNEKFYAELTKEEIDIFETICAYELDHFNYKLSKDMSEIECNIARGVRWKFSFWSEELYMLCKIQLDHFFSDKNNRLRYKKFWWLKFIRFFR